MFMLEISFLLEKEGFIIKTTNIYQKVIHVAGIEDRD